MRAVVQRVKRACVRVGGAVTGQIDTGLLVLLGVEQADTEKDAQTLAAKTAGLRVFSDATGKMCLGASDVDGGFLVVSNFTLYGDCRKGRRPEFTRAAGAEQAQALYHAFVQALCGACVPAGMPVETGRFGADMQIEMDGDGPVTLVLDTADWR
ncbi:MAG: D-aminoacyl-tRNA deacylase [Ethanoligenens sp.]